MSCEAIRPILFSLVILNFSAHWAQCGEYEVRVVVGDITAKYKLSLSDKEAVSDLNGNIERFDLANMRWKLDGKKDWISEVEARRWAMLRRREMIEKLDSFTEAHQAFYEWALVPEYEVRTEENRVVLHSGHVDHEFRGRVTDSELELFLKYSRLNAYKHAMQMRLYPPYLEIRKLDQMKEYGSIPKQVITRMHLGETDQTSEISYTRIR